MSRIFISHSSGDNAAALAIAQWLTDSGWDDYFLDITPERGLAPGERWQAALKAAADRCEVVLFLISPSWQRSRWCLAEFLLAKQLGKAIFGVLIEPTPLEHLPDEMTSEWQLCDLTQGNEQRTYAVEQAPHVPRTDVRFASAGLDRLRIGLQRAGLDPSTFPWPPANDPDRSPYPGLRALDTEDAAVLFGRDAMIVRGLDQLRRTRERGIEHLFVIVGASGAGKSSFLRAGLLPRLARDDRQFLPLPVIRPERAAINGGEGLIASLERAFKARGVNRSRAQLRSVLEKTRGLAHLLGELRDVRPRVLDDASAPPTLVIPIDQGEELFAADAGAEGSALVAHLGPLVSPEAVREGLPHVIVLGSIRADSLDLMQSQPSLQDLPTVLFNLPPVARGEFKGVIEGPAARHTASGRKLTIDPALTEHLMADAEGADAMPLLALTLQRLYLEHGADGALTLAGYERMGGLRGSIEDAVEAAFMEPSRSPAVPEDARERLECLRQAFVPWLASVDPDTGERKRRVARWEDIPEPSRPLIDRLVRQRLLIKDRRRVREGEPESVVVEVAHEALIRQWPPLRTWLDEEEADLRNLEGVRRAAAEWGRNECDAEWLVHTGERLDDAEALTRWPDFKAMLGEEGVAYLGACRKRDNDVRAEREAQLALISRQQEQVEDEQKRTAEAQQRTARFQRWTNVALGGVAVVLAGTGWWIVKQTRDVALQTSFVIAQNAERASDGFLATRSVPQTARALRLAVAAARSSPLAPAHPAAGLQLGRAAQAFRGVQVIELPAAVINAAALTPDGTRLVATDGKQGTVQLWDVTSGTELVKLTGLEGGIWRSFSPDGERMVVGAGDASPQILDVKSGRTIARLAGHAGKVLGAQFARDGKQVITRGDQDAPRLWSTEDGRMIASLEGHAAGSVSVSFGRDGTRALTRGKDSVLRLWDLTDGRLVAALEGHAGVPSWRFSRDGARIVTSSGKDVPLLWDAATGQRIARLEGHGGAVQTTFTTDGTRLVTHSANDSTRLWNAVSGAPIARFGTALTHLVSPDGERVVTVSADRAVRLWDSADGRAMAVLHAAGDGSASTLRYSADGKRLLLQTGKDTAEVWDVVNGVRMAGIRSEEPFRSVTLRGDGRLLVTTAKDVRRIWDAGTGKPIHAFEDPTSLEFNAAGTHLVAIGKAGDPQLWRTSGQHVADLAGHIGRVSAKFSPDGARLLTIDESTVPRLWDTATGGLIASLPGHSGRVTLDRFTRDGTRLLTRGSDNAPRLWDATTGQLLAVLSGHTLALSQIRWTRDELHVQTASSDGTVRIWDIAPPREMLYRGAQPVSRMAATADGRHLVEADDRTTRMIRLREREVAYTVERPIDETLIAIPDYGVVARFGPNAVRVLDSEKGRVRYTLDGHTDRILGASLSPDRKFIATASADRTVRLWNTGDGQAAHVLAGHGGAVKGVAFSMNGKEVATRADDGMGMLWDARTGRRTATLAGHTGAITFIAFGLKASRVLTTSVDRTARVWDTPTGRPVKTLGPHPAPVQSGMLSYDGTRAVTVAGRVASIWDVERGTRIQTLGGSEVLFAALDAKGDRAITVDVDGDIRVWDAGTGNEIADFPGDRYPHRAVLDEAGGSAIAISKDGRVRAWDIKTRTLRDARHATLEIKALAIDPAGKRLLVGWSDGIARLHDAEDGRVVLTYAEHEQAVIAAAFAPDGHRAATGSSDGAVRIWDVKGGKTLQEIAGKGGIDALAFSPDGAQLALADSDGTEVRILDAQSARKVGALSGHAGAVVSIAFSADGARIATVSKDKTARVWDVKTGKAVAVIEALGAEMRAATLDAQGTWLVTTFADRSSRLWDVATGELLASLDDDGGPAGFAAFASGGERVITASRGGVVSAWDLKWLARARDRTLIEAVCREQLVGALSIVTAADVRDAPLLTGRVGEDVCAGVR